MTQPYRGMDGVLRAKLESLTMQVEAVSKLHLPTQQPLTKLSAKTKANSAVKPKNHASHSIQITSKLPINFPQPATLEKIEKATAPGGTPLGAISFVFNILTIKPFILNILTFGYRAKHKGMNILRKTGGSLPQLWDRKPLPPSLS